jgi:hypothetical protein
MKRLIAISFLVGAVTALIQNTSPSTADACYVKGNWNDVCDCECAEGVAYKNCNREYQGEAFICGGHWWQCDRDTECKDNMCLPTCGMSGSGS